MIFNDINENQRAKAELACIIGREYINQIKEWKTITERILTLQFESRAKVMYTICSFHDNRKSIHDCHKHAQCQISVPTNSERNPEL